MKPLSPPVLDHKDLYAACASQTRDADSRNRLLALSSRIVKAGRDYCAAAQAGALHSVESIEMTTSERSEMRDLYDRRMVARTGTGRYAYDEIHSSSDYCPYCSFGEVYELDHFLPKETFYDLNVFPQNLLPICHPCNHLKRQKRPAGPNESFLHPYFDRLPETIRWLFAELEVRDGGPTLTYFVSLNEDEYGGLAGKLIYHFRELRLEKRFRRQAAAVLVELEAEMTQLAHELEPEQIAAHLLNRADQFGARNLNSLETAAYYAAAASEVYRNGNFRN